MIWQTISIFLLAYVLYRLQPKDSFWRMVYWPALGVRIAAAFLLGWIYMSYLGAGDMVNFHRLALVRFQEAINDPGAYWLHLFTAEHPVFKAEARTELFTKLLSIIYLLAGGSYWVAAAIMASLSFFCAYYFSRKLSSLLPQTRTVAVIAFLAWPSVLFWTSGMLKDTLTNSALILLAGVAAHYHYRRSQPLSHGVITLISLLILFYLKFYLAAMAGLALGLLATDTVLKGLSVPTAGRVTLLLVSTITLLGMLSMLNFNLNFNHFPEAINSNYQEMIANGGLHIQFETIAPTYQGIIGSLPESLVAGLFRPFPFEGSWWLLPFELESLTLLLLVVLNLIWWRAIRINSLGWCALLFCMALATFLPLAAPVFGTLVRYKTAYMPFLVFVLLYTPYGKLFHKA